MKELIVGIINLIGGLFGFIFYLLEEFKVKLDTDLFLYLSILIILLLLMINVYRLSKVNDNSFYKSVYILLISSSVITMVGYALWKISSIFSIINVVGGIIMIVYSIRINYCTKPSNKV